MPQVYDEAHPALSSPVASFTTPPASTPASTDTLRMLVAADIGTLQDSNGWQYPRELGRDEFGGSCQLGRDEFGGSCQHQARAVTPPVGPRHAYACCSCCPPTATLGQY